MRVAFIISFLTALYTAHAGADITIRYDLINNNLKRPAHLVMIKSELVRIDNKLGQQPDLMLNLSTGDIVQLNSQDREYFKINATTINQYVDLYRQNSVFFQALITQGIQQLDPQTRTQVEQMMQSYEQKSTDPSSLKLENTGKTGRVLGVPCQVHALIDQGLRVRDLCLADYQQLGLEPDVVKSFEMLKKLVRQFKLSSPQQQDLLGILADGIENLNGVPLKVVEYYANGKVRNIIQAGSISLKKVPSIAYQIPRDYQQRLTPIL